MKLILDADPRIHLVRSYDGSGLVVNDVRFEGPCIVSPDQSPGAWPVKSLADLEAADLQPLLALQPQIILVGGRMAANTPLALLRRKLAQRAVAVEIMELGAACRTYNILAQEARRVVAGLIP